MKNIFIFIIFIALAGCNNHQKKQEEKRKEVMQIHDEAMAKMDALHNYEVKSRNKAKLLRNNPLKTDSANTYKNLTYSLVNAQENMMEWMHQYNIDSASNQNPNANEYLNKQKVLVQKVNTDIFEALKSAEELGL